ncbi:MAG TPA: hypothetical protein VF791_22825, partial [Pyrinomonadaceae bacterium]
LTLAPVSRQGQQQPHRLPAKLMLQQALITQLRAMRAGCLPDTLYSVERKPESVFSVATLFLCHLKDGSLQARF